MKRPDPLPVPCTRGCGKDAWQVDRSVDGYMVPHFVVCRFGEKPPTFWDRLVGFFRR